jgi:PTS system ascorbate-specific IIB component
MGSSLMLRIYVEELLKEVGLKAEVTVADMLTVKAHFGDLMITTPDVLRAVKEVPSFRKVVVLKSLVSQSELREKVLPAITELLEELGKEET